MDYRENNRPIRIAQYQCLPISQISASAAVLWSKNTLSACSPRIYVHDMTTTLQAWGNSQGVRIPKALLAALQLKIGARLELDLSPTKDAIIVKPSHEALPLRGRHRLEDLLAKMPRNYKSQEFFGEARGREVW